MKRALWAAIVMPAALVAASGVGVLAGVARMDALNAVIAVGTTFCGLTTFGFSLFDFLTRDQPTVNRADEAARWFESAEGEEAVGNRPTTPQVRTGAGSGSRPKCSGCRPDMRYLPLAVSAVIARNRAPTVTS